MIDDIITMRAPGAGFKNRRSVNVGYAEIEKIADPLLGVGEAKFAMELQPVGRRRNAHARFRSRLCGASFPRDGALDPRSARRFSQAEQRQRSCLHLVSCAPAR